MTQNNYVMLNGFIHKFVNKDKLKISKTGDPYCFIVMKVIDRFVTDEGKIRDSQQYFYIEAWKEPATELAKLDLLDEVQVQGRMRSYMWRDKQRGIMQYTIAVMAEEVNPTRTHAGLVEEGRVLTEEGHYDEDEDTLTR